MPSRLDKQKIQSITIKPLLSQLPGRCVFTVTQVRNAFGVYTESFAVELVMGWVHPWVGLGWVGSEFFFNFWWIGLGWAET